MCLVDLFGSGYINSRVNLESGLVEVSYSAYSCDSSFDEELELSHCPSCGQTIKNIIANENKRLAKEKLKRIKETEKIKERDRIDQLEREEMNRVQAIQQLEENNKLLAEGTYLVFSNGSEEYRAVSRKHLRVLYNNISHTKFKAIKSFVKGVEDINFIRVEVSNNKKNNRGSKFFGSDVVKKERSFSVDMNNYEINKNSHIKDNLICPNCGNGFVKKTQAHAFCSIPCKDRFWNVKRYGK